MSDAVHAHWEVTRAKNAGQKPNPHGGQFDKFYVSLKNLDGGTDSDDAYWQRQHPSEVTVGDKVYGKLEKREGDQGDRFFMEKEPDGGAPSSGSEARTGTGGGSSQRDDVGARIERQAIIKALGEKLSQTDSLTGAQKRHIEEIEAFVGQAASQRAGGAGQTDRTAGGSQGAGGTSLAADKQPADEPLSLQEIGEVLNRYGLSYAPARDKVASHIGFKLFSEGRADAALKGLESDESRERVMAKLKEECGPLPEPPASDLPPPDRAGLGGDDDGKDIPFRRPEYREVFDERMRWRF